MIGIFIGSFNPVTKAHIEICELLKNDFEKIILVPVNSRDKYLVSFRDRINMLTILTRKYNYLEISNVMKNYSYLNYRIIDLLKKEYGDIGIIVGSDLLDKLDTFDNYDYLLQNYKIYVITRDSDVNEIINKKYLKYKNKFKIIEFNSNISSTMAREYIKNNLDTKDILNKDVLDYIKINHLY